MRDYAGVAYSQVDDPLVRRALATTDYFLRDLSRGLGRVEKGQVPSGSGASIATLGDDGTFFKLAGRSGGQVAYGDTNDGGTLTLGSTRSASKGFIYFGAASSFDEVNVRLGLNTLLPGYRIHNRASAVGILERQEDVPQVIANCVCNGTITVNNGANPFGAITIGMSVSGSLIAAGTTVATVPTIGQITLSQAATGSGTITLSFANVTDFGFVLNGAGPGTDSLIKSSSGLQLTASSQTSGQQGGLRVAVQTGVGSTVRAFLEAGPTNQNFALSGYNAVTGNSLQSLFSFVGLVTWNGTSVTQAARVGVNQDPFDYSGSAAGSQPGSLIVARQSAAAAGVPTLLVEGASSTQEAISIRGASGGSTPNQAIAAAILGGIRHNGDIELCGGGVQGLLNGSGPAQVTVTDTSANLILQAGSNAAWSDSLAAANSRYLKLGYLAGGHRACILTNDGFNAFTRFGISSLYTLISNAQAGSAGFAAPEASPTVLRLINHSTGGADASVLLKLQSNRAGQSGDFLEVITSASAVPLSIDSTGALHATQSILGPAGGSGTVHDTTIGVALAGFTGGLYLDDNSGFTSQLVIVTSGLSANRTITVPDASGGLILSGIKALLIGSTGTTLDVSTATNGTSFIDSVTSTKRLRFVLSGSVGNNSITLTNTAARNFGLGDLGGNLAVVGDQAPAVSAGRLGKIDLTAQAAAIGSTNLSSTPPAGMYAVRYYLEDTTADATAGTIQVQVNYTDDVGATNQTSAALVLTTTGRTSGTFTIYVASGDISYQTNLTGIIGTAKYAVRIRVVSLG